MPTDNQVEPLQKDEYRLSMVMAGGLFFLLMLISVALLTVTYISSHLIVENEDNKLHEQSGVISNLVAETRLEVLKHSIDLISEDRIFNTFDVNSEMEQKQSYLNSAFYTQRESTIDMLALLSNDGEYLAELSTETNEFQTIKNDIRRVLKKSGSWHWASQGGGGTGQPLRMLFFYKREILNSITGNVEGTLVGGLFVNSNRKFIREIKKKSGSEFAALTWNGNVLSAAGRIPGGLIGDELTLIVQDLHPDRGSSKFYVSDLLKGYFPGAGFSIVTSYPASSEETLDRLLIISSSLAVLLAMLLSAVSVFVARLMFLKPLKELILYARRVECQDSNPDVPESSIIEFNEVGRTLESVFSAFQESETRFRDFVSVSTDSVWETDVHDRYVFLSRDQNSRNTLDMNQVLGKKRWEVEGVDQEYGNWNEHWKTLARRDAFRNFIFRRMDARGRMIYWSASGKPRFDAQGKYCGFRGSSSDITSEIEAQNETKKMQEMLRQSQKLEVVGQLTGGVAHDFNNLLAVIMGNLELIEESGMLNEREGKHLSDALKGTERGAALTHQLLAYARQQTLRPITVQPSNVIWEMCNRLETMLGGGISLKTLLRESWSVLIDPTELEKALLKLVLNAKDAMPNGGELIIECFDIHLDQEFVETVADLKAGDYVCLVVSDTGEGIPENIQDRILEPFFTTKEVGKGSGLGLSMVFGFLKQSGGHISIYSEQGKGTSVQLFLPRAFIAKEQKHREKSVELKYGNGELVLVVEDNLQVRQLVVSQLKSLQYKTMECEDGPMALSILEKEPIDILLSDVTLPLGLNGMDIVNFAQEQDQHMAKLLMSGFTGDTIRSHDDLPENVEILYKPFTKLRLSQALNLAIKQRLKPGASVSTE